MSTDDYQVHNIYRYTRKSYKHNRNSRDSALDNSREDVDHAENSRENTDFEVIDRSPRSDDYGMVSPVCLYDLEPEGDIANILHKKCPVITLAQQQLLRILDETNHLLARVPEEHCSALFRYLCRCKQASLLKNKASCFIALILVAFLTGFLFGAATCGTHYGKFNNPILNCVDNYFIPDSYTSIEDTFRCIT